MAAPFTIKYGSWSPDLQNVAVTMPFQAAATEIPSSDCLNVYYRDGAFRCLPAPAAAGPAASAQVLNALTWYDNVEGQEIIFGATASTINTLIDGVWSTIPFAQSVTIQGVGLSLAIRLGATNPGRGVTITTTLGSGVARGQLFNGTVYVDDVYGDGSLIEFAAGGTGILTPANDVNGNQITNFRSGTYLQTGIAIASAASLGQSYFSTLTNNANTLLTSSGYCTYGYSGGVSSWEWTSPVITVADGSLVLS